MTGAASCGGDAAELDERDLRTIEEFEQLVAAARAAQPAEPVPCFARLRIETGGRVRDLLLGPRTLLGGGVSVLHWQTAPLGAVFFSCVKGDDYEIDAEGRIVSGTVLLRDLLGVERGALVEVVRRDALLSRRDGTWRRVPRGAPILWARPKEARARPPSPILPVLDAAQQRAVNLPPGRALLVLGEAGCGKTTVVLHRLAALRAAAQERGRPFRALVLLPTEGLRRLSKTLLELLGAADAEVRVYDRWAARQAARAFPGAADARKRGHAGGRGASQAAPGAARGPGRPGPSPGGWPAVAGRPRGPAAPVRGPGAPQARRRGHGGRPRARRPGRGARAHAGAVQPDCRGGLLPC